MNSCLKIRECDFYSNTIFSNVADIDENCVDISMTVTSRKTKLLFEMVSGDKTKHFISELHRIAESMFSKYKIFSH